MPKHDDLLNQGPRDAPEPETAEEKSKKLGLKTAGGAVVGGGAVAAKAGAIGGIGKLVAWIAVWNLFARGGWIALAVLVALALVFVVWRRSRTA